MTTKRYINQNLDTYSTWKQNLSSEMEARFACSKPQNNTKTSVFKVALLSLGLVFLVGVITQLIAMSQFATLGYEIEQLQAQKTALAEESDQLRTAIAVYQTTQYYEAKANEKAMVKPDKMVYLQHNQ